MTDRIDTDVTRGNIEQLRGCADADLGSHDVRWCLSVMDRLCDEVDRLRALADPAPVGLTEDERLMVERIQGWSQFVGSVIASSDAQVLLAIIDRLSPGVAEPPHVTHIFKAGGLYGWGCSCGESDGTHETRALAVQGADWHKVHGVAGRCACGFPERHTNLPCSR